MKYILLSLICIMLIGCLTPSHTDSDMVYAVDNTVRGQSFANCVHDDRDFDTIVMDRIAWTNLLNVCELVSWQKNKFITTYGELAKHPNWTNRRL